jgi:hypothetical protein
MSEETLEYLLDGPFAVQRPGYDGRVYAWHIGAYRVEVRFTETAVEVGAEGLSTRAEKALESLGRTEAIEFLQWKTPPEWIEFSTDNLPWIEGGEIDDDPQ